MLKPEHMTNAMLRKILKRAFCTTTEDGAWLIVNEGLPSIVSLQIGSDRQLVRLDFWYRLPHLDETEIAVAACRLNAEYFLVNFVAANYKISMHYALPYGEGLNPATLIRVMRRFVVVTADAFATVPKPLADTRPAEKPHPQRLH